MNQALETKSYGVTVEEGYLSTNIPENMTAFYGSRRVQTGHLIHSIAPILKVLFKEGGPL